MAGRTPMRFALLAVLAAVVISFDMDEEETTSLLQVQLEMQTGRNGHLPSPDITELYRLTRELNQKMATRHVVAADVPEASRAWALYQRVPSGTPRPWALANDTVETPPGEPVPGWTQLFRAAMNDAYETPDKITEEIREEWGACLGKSWETTNASAFSTSVINAVVVPQLVPFVVPMDHPKRTDITVIIAPGGGNRILAWESEGTDVAKWLNALGISAFVLKYRVPAAIWGGEADVQDAQRAVGLVKHMAPALGLNASRVGFFGASAGGGIALRIGFAKGRVYDRRDVADGASPKPDFLLLLYPGVGGALAQFSADPDAFDLSHGPPIFVANGAQDACCSVEELYKLHMLLKSQGDPVVELNIYTDVGHAFTMCYRIEGGGWEAMQHEACVWMLRARRFIMWNVERKAPRDIDQWYAKVVKFDTSLIATNSSGSRDRS